MNFKKSYIIFSPTNPIVGPRDEISRSKTLNLVVVTYYLIGYFSLKRT